MELHGVQFDRGLLPLNFDPSMWGYTCISNFTSNRHNHLFVNNRKINHSTFVFRKEEHFTPMTAAAATALVVIGDELVVLDFVFFANTTSIR